MTAFWRRTITNQPGIWRTEPSAASCTTMNAPRPPSLRRSSCRRTKIARLAAHYIVRAMIAASYGTRHASLPSNMRTSGMIGGLGPESTVDYYRSIIARYRARKPDGGYPHVILNSLDVDKSIALLDAGRLDQLADYLAS